MKLAKPKRSIYLRTFTWLLSIWLILMLGFSAYLLHGEKIAAKNAFEKDVNSFFSAFNPSNYFYEHDFKLQRAMKSLSNHSFSTKSFEYAVYSTDYDFIYASGDTWICAYSRPDDTGNWKPQYGFLHPEKWFSEEEIEQIVYYLTYKSESKKLSDVYSYSVELFGWIDGDEFIPGKVYVVSDYIRSFDEQGNVNSTGGGRIVDCEPTFDTGYKDTRGLTPFEFGRIEDGYSSFNVNLQESETHLAVTDQNRLEDSAVNFTDNMIAGKTNETKTIGLFTNGYYMITPYNTLKEIDNKWVTDYWISISGEFNYLSGILPTLLIIWLMCLGVFSGAAWILSSQTWKTYQRREELEKQRKNTTNAIAHDLKTPLAAISGYAENLVSNVHTEKREHYATRILENARRMDQIVQEMLGLSRLESGTQKISPEELSLDEVTEAVTGAYADIFAEKNITCSIIGEASVTADKALISRAIDNFVSNAAANTNQGGKIEILITDHRWSITNTGMQIPDDQLKAIWQAYYKTDSARSNPKGSGLGLSIVKSIIDLHGFTCGVENVAPGVLFWFEY